MIKTITPALAQQLGWHIGEREQKVIRACFFLGYGTTFVTELVHNPMRQDEATLIIEAASELGMSDNDEVQILPLQGNFFVRGRRSTEGNRND